MRAASAHPGFECSKARSSVEKAICTDPKLAALDVALSWLWSNLKHTPALNAAPKKMAFNPRNLRAGGSEDILRRYFRRVS
jgi:uncharacterized protein